MSPNTIPPEPDNLPDAGVGKTIRRRVVTRATCGCGTCIDCEFGDGRKTTETIEHRLTHDPEFRQAFDRGFPPGKHFYEEVASNLHLMHELASRLEAMAFERASPLNRLAMMASSGAMS